jgi:hypothetical protein
MTHISKRLDSLARFELLKLGGDKQPAALMEPARFRANTVFANAQMHWDRANDDFTPPYWWTYYDKELSKWYDMIYGQLQTGKDFKHIKMIG